ncbi:DNA repair protein RadA [Parasporobacterium paucivorans]|uniref:DNA repair protein RadA n=1 Tax=Parasporobacterium paucivorans DSM 15970 TaxID=1122934 RepID=A0A1M6HGY2_9FIRM|nr:DNA repair protein RadA [Parasporobacterium paucivorans]SHJ21458.1 DNA repair protein RadA/Sms [Parasporobacterium paucivorans DSM 15970]
MAKAKATAFFCKECGFETTKWAGQCPACREWNSLVEAPATVSVKKANANREMCSSRPLTLSGVNLEDDERTRTGFEELDGVLGGGIVRGSLVLVGGDPGIGKSTLLLQVCKNVSDNHKVLYVSGEESLKQIKIRANRIGEFSDNLFLLCETSIGAIEDAITELMPEIVIIDSIQTMYMEEVSSSQGSVSQVRESTNALMHIAKGKEVSIFIVGHVTKEGVVAGPRVLEHMVDTVLYFEGDRNATYRILRSVKNRFGSTNEIGVFEMSGIGLKEVKNPSEFMLDGRPHDASGSVVACSIEGTRPIMVEIQALVAKSGFGMPRRTAAGTDYNRVNLLMAVLEKRLGMHLGDYDAYINVAGGMKINEPALDLAIAMALVSSYKEKVMDSDTVVFGEIGLSGEVRSVSQAANRVNEAMKLGFKRCILPRSCAESLKAVKGIELVGVASVRDAVNLL